MPPMVASMRQGGRWGRYNTSLAFPKGFLDGVVSCSCWWDDTCDTWRVGWMRGQRTPQRGPGVCRIAIGRHGVVERGTASSEAAPERQLASAIQADGKVRVELLLCREGKHASRGEREVVSEGKTKRLSHGAVPSLWPARSARAGGSAERS